MKILAVDDEPKALNSFLRVLKQVAPLAEVTALTEPEEAFAYLSHNQVDIAFLDIKMGGLTGLGLAKKCEQLCPGVNIIFVTGYSEYALDALRLHVSGYLIKPVRAEDLRAELENLRTPLPPPVRQRVRVQTFGDFDLFVDGKPFPFPTAKCKELLAYLIDRKGARVTYSELSSVLWENLPYDRTAQNNLHGTLFKLMRALDDAGVAEIIRKGRKEIAVDTSKLSCDYYDALAGRNGRSVFLGEYMSNYSWAEVTLSELLRITAGC